MKLSEFYTEEKFYYSIDGYSFYRDSIKTPHGELYVDEERDLYYRENSSSHPTLIHSDVGEWLYFNDNKIICSFFYDGGSCDSSYICIIDIRGKHIASGTLNSFGLTYTKDKKVINENSKQEERIILELKNDDLPVFYNDASITMAHYYPYCDFIYTRFYDYNGKYLEAETKSHFVQMFLRDLTYGFIKHIPIKDGVFDLTNEQMNKLQTLEQIRFNTNFTQVNIELVDHIIEIIEEMGYANKYAVKGYQIIKKIFIKHGLKDNLVLPLLNVMAIERSGDFGRRSHKWTSVTNAKRIEQIAKKTKNDFPNIVNDINLLWKYMKDIVA